VKQLIKPRSVKVNSIISFLGIFISRILGFIRDMLIGYFFGTSPVTDAFNITMKVIFYLANQISSAFNIGFLSLFIHEKEKEGEEKAKQLASSLISFVAALGLVVSILIFLLAPWIGKLYPGINEITYSYLVSFLRWTSFAFFFIITSGILWSLFQSYHIFTIPYLAVFIQNATIVIVIYIFHTSHALPLSVLIATTLMFIFTTIPVKHVLRINIRKPSSDIVAKFLAISSPTLISTGIIYFSVLADQIMASFMPTGSITRLEYANKIASLPPAMFGIAIAGAFFPRLSELVSRKQWKDFQTLLENGISAIWFLTIPSAVGLIFLADKIVHLLFYFPGGKFSLEDVHLTAMAMAMYAIGIPFQSAIIAFNRGHYAFKDTMTPLKTSSFALFINVIFNYLFGIILNMGIMGLALGTSLASIVNFYMLGHTLEKKISGKLINMLLKDFIRITAYSIPMSIVLICSNLYLGQMHKITTILIIFTAVFTYGITVILVKPKELNILRKRNKV